MSEQRGSIFQPRTTNISPAEERRRDALDFVAAIANNLAGQVSFTKLADEVEKYLELGKTRQ